MIARRGLLAAAATMLVAAGCSAGTVTLDAGRQGVLQADVRELTQAAATSDWPTAHAALEQLRSDLASAIAAGQITDARAAAMRTHLAAVAADITARISTPAPSPSPSPTRPTSKPAPKPKPAPPPKHGHKHHGGGDD